MNKINESNSNNIEKLNTNNHNNSLIQESRKQESPQTTSSVKDSEIVNVVNNKKDILFIKDRINNNSGKIKKTGSGKNKFTNSFSINFSAGPDVSAVTFDNIGKVNAAYGIGIGYNISKNWNVRTGFYIEKKLYQARPSDYHPPVRFWYNFPDLKTIDADCKVYAVPVIVSYNISENQKKIWFAGVGLASYFMKKETYDYNSKSASGQTSYISYTINNKNKHYFSILRLSAGYERKLSDNISFITEPYIGTPLSGVGFGKVKLYSSGVSFTLKVKPFSKK